MTVEIDKPVALNLNCKSVLTKLVQLLNSNEG